MSTHIARIVSIVLVAWALSQRDALAIDWKTNANGNFNTGSNWVGNVVPTSTATATFGVGIAASYTVTLNGAAPGFPAVVHTVDRLLVGSNTVTLARNSLLGATSLVANDNLIGDVEAGIEVGQLATDNATLNTSIPITSDTATIADAAGSVGTWNVNAGSLTLNTDDFFYVGRQGTGMFNITGGATVSHIATLPTDQIGYYPESTGTVTVSGAGSQFVGHVMNVGNSGTGTLNILAGGKVSGFDADLGLDDNSMGSATVDGLGSVWDVGAINVGGLGDATMSITRGGVMTNSSGSDIAGGPDSAASVTVDGTGSAWNTGEFRVGSGGQGTLLITNGGRVTASSPGYLGFLAGANGNVTVDGVGAALTYSQNLSIGDGGSGNMSVVDGGQLSSGTSTIGEASTAFGQVTIDGTGSKWTNTGDLVVGNLGNGALSVTGGGQVMSGGGFVGQAGEVSVATVDGSGSKWIDSGQLHVGQGFSDFLYILDGGQVVDATGFIGTVAKGNGTVIVSGANSNWTNAGSVTIGGAGAATLNISAGGTVSVGTTIPGSTLSIGALGTVKGDGTMVGNVSNGGVIAPGNGLGALRVTGDVAQTATGKLQIELDGTLPGSQYDQLVVTGAVALNGSLQVVMIGGFKPASGESFNIVTATEGVSGSFTSAPLPSLAGGLVLNLEYEPNAVILSVGGALGDYNHNGIVDAADYVVYRDTFGHAGAGLAADGDQNGTIDQADDNVWRSNFGTHAGSGSGATANAAVVPEPATLVLLTLAPLGWCLRRGRAHRKSQQLVSARLTDQ